MRGVAFIVVAVLVLAWLVPGEASAQSSVWASGNGLLVIRSDRDGEPDVFTIDPTSSATTKLTTKTGAAELQPVWSPEGDRIAFVRRAGQTARTDLFVMNAAGRGRVRLTSTAVPERDPSWSPSGAGIVYAARTRPGGPFRIFAARADGSGRTRLTDQAAGSADRSPVWSPDGTRIAFVSDRAGGFPELYLMSASGTGVVRLTNNTLIDANPSWSPDGTKLVFERCCVNGTSDLFTIDVATRGEVDLTASPTRQEFDPTWSPDGSRVAYVAFDVGQGNPDVWVMNADGTAPTRITEQAGPDLSPDWQPVPICTINGGPQGEVLTGTDASDVICAGGGDDDVRGLAGDDLVLAGAGSDEIQGQAGADVLVGQGGSDVLGGGSEYDVLDGGVGTDTCKRGGDGALLRRCEL